MSEFQGLKYNDLSDENKKIVEKVHKTVNGNISESQLGDAMIEFRQKDVTVYWQQKCNPLEKWCREKENLRWFVDPTRVSLEGQKTGEIIRTKYPNLPPELFFYKLLEAWHDQLFLFATSNGYSNTQSV